MPDTAHRYPWAPLAAASGLSEHQLAIRLAVSGSTEQQYRRDGMSELVADRMACKLDLHPFEVWPEMIEHQAADVSKACDHCGDGFIPDRRNARFCSTRCYRRWWAREQRRKRYATDPTFAAAQRARRRDYYAENGTYERARERRRYDEKRAAA